MKKNNKNADLYPKTYVAALAREALEELHSCKNPEEMERFSLLIKIKSENEAQQEFISVLSEILKKGVFDRLAFREILTRMIEV